MALVLLFFGNYLTHKLNLVAPNNKTKSRAVEELKLKRHGRDFRWAGGILSRDEIGGMVSTAKALL